MAYVAPNGRIQLFRGLNLTPAYTDTIWFPSISAQNSMFEQIVRYDFANQMYTRVNGNKVRVNIVADEIRDCSYMRFQNIRNNKSKWFYAFILDVEYVNEQVTEITYEIDDIQSWYFEDNSNNHFNACFIERQHSTHDVAGDNLQPEPLVPETYVANGNLEEGTFVTKQANGSAVGYILAIGAFTLNKEGNTIFTNFTYGGLATSIKYLYFDTPAEIKTFLNRMDIVEGGLRGLLQTGDLWDLLGIYVVPVPEAGDNIPFFSTVGANISILGGSVKQLSQGVYARELTSSSGLPKPLGFGEGLQRYYPKNKKLFTYPYSFLKVQTPTKSMEFRYELFGSNPRFCYVSGCNPEPYFFIYPIEYGGDPLNIDYSLLLDDFPKIPTYQSGLMNSVGQKIGASINTSAQLALAAVLNVPAKAPAATSTAIVPATPPVYPKMPQGNTGGIDPLKAVTGLTDFKKEIPEMHEVPNRLGGNGGISSLLPSIVPKLDSNLGPIPVTTSHFKIMIEPWGILPETAEKFDKFLSMYGYAQNTVAVPNVHARTKWTYVKTRNCRCTVNAPSSSLAKINSIMDSGITWWDFRYTVGNYGNFDNPIA